MKKLILGLLVTTALSTPAFASKKWCVVNPFGTVYKCFDYKVHCDQMASADKNLTCVAQ